MINPLVENLLAVARYTKFYKDLDSREKDLIYKNQIVQLHWKRGNSWAVSSPGMNTLLVPSKDLIAFKDPVAAGRKYKAGEYWGGKKNPGSSKYHIRKRSDPASGSWYEIVKGSGPFPEYVISYVTKEEALKKVKELRAEEKIENPIHPQALVALKRMKADEKQGHDAADYWRGAAAAYFTANPSKKVRLDMKNPVATKALTLAAINKKIANIPAFPKLRSYSLTKDFPEPIVIHDWKEWKRLADEGYVA